MTLSVLACSVPVFRYALEKWPSDPYQAIVFHRGPLPETQQAVIRELSGAAAKAHANLAMHTVDLAQEPDPKYLELWKQAKGDTLPWLVLRYPTPTGLRNTIWSGPLNEAAVAKVVNSPARKEITERLAQGESAVWVMIESGDAAKDDATAELLDERLTYLAATLKLPKLDAQDVADKLVSVPEENLKLEFSSYRLSRQNPEEQVFINTLLGTEADLKNVKEPIVFPLFGRGRALYALVGKGIKRETIDVAATFLIGKCSCQVKELNPGTDLLLAADWDTLMNSPGDRDLPVFTNRPAGPETVVIQGGNSDTNRHGPHPSAKTVATTLTLTYSLAITLGVLVMAAGGMLVLRRKKPR